MKSKRLKKALIIILIIFAAALCITYIYLAEYLPARLVKPTPIITYDDLNEYNSDKAFEYDPDLHFVVKKRISKGKYGFVEKFTVKERSIIECGCGVYIKGDDQETLYKSLNLVIGIYEDRRCSKPVYEYRKLDAYEAEKAGKDDYEESIMTVIDPGTYYMGVYTTDKKDNYKVAIGSTYGYLYPKAPLVEGEEMLYYRGDHNQVNKFRIDAEKSGTVHFEPGFTPYCSAIRLLDSDGKFTREFKGPWIKENGGLINDPEFKVDKGKTYYIEMHWDTDGEDNYADYGEDDYVKYYYIEPGGAKDDR